MLDLQEHSAERAILANTASKADLLCRAKEAIVAGEQSLKAAAEALAVAQELHGATQAEMAEALGKSKAWVSYLLRWHRTGYADASPFGPKTKAARVKHAEHRAASGAALPKRKRGKASATVAAEAGVLTGEADYVVVGGGESSAASDDKPLREFKFAVDHWLPQLSGKGKYEAVEYAIKKSGVQFP